MTDSRLPDDVPTRPGDAPGDFIDQALSEVALKPGDKVGSFRILETLGEGGFGIVYLAERTQPMRQRVAIKVIKPGMDTRAVIARFEAERQALALMDHPGVAKVLDAGVTTDRRPFFVMEHVPGLSITDHCDRHRLGIAERLALFVDVCRAVQHAHQKGIIHRDIKPSNILVAMTSDGSVAKIIDFGIAKALNQRLTEKTVFTEQGQMIGTPEYMSPEQADRTVQDIDTRSDIYSLGVLLYELLTGTRPFDLKAAALAEIQRVIRDADPQRPSTRLSSLGDATTEQARQRRLDPKSLTRELRGDLDWIVMRCLEKDRARRYDTANGLAADVLRHLHHEPVFAGPPSTAYRVSKFVRRNRVGVLAAGVMVALLIAGVAGTSWGWLTALAARDAERTATEEARRQAEVASNAQLAEAAAKVQAERRADELEQVAAFQATQLGGIDVELMGVQLRRDLVESAQAAVDRAGLGEAARVDRLAQLSDGLSGINFTDVALRTIDENIFARALEAIDEQFGDQPIVRARLLHTVAETLRDLGLLEVALSPQEEALAIRRRELGEDHPDTLDSLNGLAWVLHKRGELEKAERLYRKAMDVRRSVLGDDHSHTIASINNVGWILRDQGRLDEADPYYDEALERSRRVLGEDDPNTLMFLGNMGSLRWDQGRYDDAETFYRACLEGHRRVLGDDHQDTLSAINNMGFLLQNQGRLDEAEPYLLESLERARRTLGGEHPLTLIVLGNYGYLLRIQGRFAEAEPVHHETLRLRRDVLGADHPLTLIALNNMGMLLHGQGKSDEAESCFRDLVESSRRVQGSDHPDTLKAIINYSFALKRRGAMDEAEPYYREAVGIARRVLGDDHPETLNAISNMAVFQWDLGHYAEAERLHREALAGRRRAIGDDHPATLNSIRNVGRVMQARGRLDEAETHYREALDGRRRVSGDDHRHTMRVRNDLGSVLNAQERYAEAEPLLRLSSELDPAVAGIQAWRLADARSMLGESLVGLGRYEEAEPALLAGYADLKESVPIRERHAVLSAALRRLVDLYEAWDRPDEAATWQARLAAFLDEGD